MSGVLQAKSLGWLSFKIVLLDSQCISNATSAPQGQPRLLFFIYVTQCELMRLFEGDIKMDILNSTFCSISKEYFDTKMIFISYSYQKLYSHSSVTRVTVEAKSNFKCMTSVKLAFLNFNLPPILVEGLCMHGLIQKYFLHNWYFLRYHDLFDVTRVTGYKNGFLRSLDSNGFSIKAINVTKIIFAELGT